MNGDCIKASRKLRKLASMYSLSQKDKMALITYQKTSCFLSANKDSEIYWQFMRYIPYFIKREIIIAFYAQTELHDLIQASEITTQIYSLDEVSQLVTGE